MTFPTTPAEAPRRRLSRGLLVAIIAGAVLALGFCAIVAIGVLSLLGQRVAPTTIVSADGKSQISAPGTWRKLDNLNEQADLQAGNPRQEQYLMVLTESKADLADVDLEAFAELVLGGLTGNLQSVTVSEPRNITIGDRPAIQYEVRGTLERINGVYLLTCVEGQEDFHQILAWTLVSQAEQNLPVLDQAVSSFREVAR